MSKRNRNADPREERGTPRPQSSTGFLNLGTIGLITLAGVGLLIFLNAKMWGALNRHQESLDQMDGRIVQLATKVDNAARAAAPRPQQGPDPNRVYTVKTDGSPAEGPASAPVTIAEFSDFQ